LTIACLSFLYKDNLFFRFAESPRGRLARRPHRHDANQTFPPNLIAPMLKDFGQNWDLLVPGPGVLLHVVRPKIAGLAVRARDLRRITRLISRGGIHGE
jgi:hypothetical protein